MAGGDFETGFVSNQQAFADACLAHANRIIRKAIHFDC